MCVGVESCSPSQMIPNQTLRIFWINLGFGGVFLQLLITRFEWPFPRLSFVPRFCFYFSDRGMNFRYRTLIII